MFKYGGMQRNTPSQLMCGSQDACLDYMLPGVQVTAGLGFFLYSKSLSDSENSDATCAAYF